jgi:hypothetical protein
MWFRLACLCRRDSRRVGFSRWILVHLREHTAGGNQRGDCRRSDYDRCHHWRRVGANLQTRTGRGTDRV